MCYNDFSHANKGYPYYSLEVSPAAKAAGGIPANSGLIRVFIDGRWGTISAVEQAWSQADLDVFLALREGQTTHDGLVYIKASSFKHTGSQQTDKDWVPVVYENFDNKEAQVICRELGYAGEVSVCCGDRYPNVDTLDVDMATVASNCTGTERAFRDCAVVKSIGNVRNGVYASVSCFATVKSKDLGSLVVLYNGVEGNICPDGWTDQDAQVVCKELGYPHGQKYLHTSWYAGLQSIFWSSNFQCTGKESRLSECQHDGWGHTRTCRYAEAFAGVICYMDATWMKVCGSRMIKGVKYRIFNPDPQATWGRVEVMRPETSTWATLCNEPSFAWSETEANVVCRMFGYKSGQVIKVAQLPRSQGPVYERYEDCQGHEDSLEHCVHEGFVPAYSNTCHRRNAEAGVFCTPYAHSGDDAKTKDQTKDLPSSSASIFSSPSSSASISSSFSVDVGAIVGGVLGMIAVCGVLVAGAMFWRRFTQHTLPRSPVEGIPNLVYDTRLDQIHLQPSV
ncbi:hypothetical protein ACOMHN_029930 [Nucella lapillus]